MNSKRILFFALTCTFLLSCGGGDKDYIASIYDVFPYSKKAHPNLECALTLDAEDESKHCSLGKLPLIGTITVDPTKEDIEKRLLVSHMWMGNNFMKLIDDMPDDIRLMLRSVTAIVIADNIRPSFYTTETGAIYLDPESLWVTQDERSTISEEPDYRSNFSDGLNFTGLWRYLREDGTRARAPSINRKLEDLTFPLARLLFHELAHANTFLPPGVHDSINPKHKVIEAAESFADLNASVMLQDALPLESQIMKDLAFVMFRGETATEEQTALSGLDVGTALASDRANDDYAYVPYSDEVYYEDVAMLLEELMSKYHFNHDREIAYTNAANTSYCSDYVVQWGQTGRIGDADVKEAARLAVKALIPESDLDSFIDNLDTPTQTTEGVDWCSPLYLEAKQVKAKTLNPGIELESIAPQVIDISDNFRSPHYH